MSSYTQDIVGKGKVNMWIKLLIKNKERKKETSKLNKIIKDFKTYQWSDNKQKVIYKIWKSNTSSWSQNTTSLNDDNVHRKVIIYSC